MEVLTTLTQSVTSDALSTAERNKLLTYCGRWYEQKLGRPDTALRAYQQILTTDPANEEAYDALAGLYRKAHQWPELAAALAARADAAGGSTRARDARAEAAEVYEQKLDDAARAQQLYAQVLAEDPSHPKAVDGAARIAERSGDFASLVVVLDRRAESLRGRDKVEALLKAAEVYEARLDNLGEASRRYEAVLAVEPQDLMALKGLDRIYTCAGKYRELLDNLETQVAIAATPRQKITLFERMARLHEEEFLSPARAAECLEQILAIDPANEAAMSTLPRAVPAARSVGQARTPLRAARQDRPGRRPPGRASHGTRTAARREPRRPRPGEGRLRARPRAPAHERDRPRSRREAPRAGR